MTEIKEVALTESRTLRDQYAGRTDVLDKVKALSLLPDDMHTYTRAVAAYYEVPIKTIESVVEDNREELEANGYRVLAGAELREFAAPFGGVATLLGPKVRSMAFFSRRTVLNVGQLLRDSSIARQVRTYLLDAEETLTEIEMARRYVAALERGQALEAENAKLRVKAEQFDDWLNGKGCYLIGTVAKMLSLKPKALWDFLYAEKILINRPGNKRHREPYSRTDTENWFEIKAVPPERANGHATRTTYLTPYGAEQIRLRLIKRGLLPHEQLALIEGSA